MLCKWRALGVTCLTLAAILCWNVPALQAQSSIIRTPFTTNLTTIGNGLLQSANTLHFGQAAAYTAGRIPFASSASAITFDANFVWDNSAKALDLVSGGFGTTISLESATGDIHLTGTTGKLHALTVGANAGIFTNSLTLPFGTASTLLSLNGSKAAASIANGTGALTNDGSGNFGYTALSGNVTNTYNTIITTNLTVVNALTVSNIVTTNLTVMNNMTVSNLYVQNGNHNTMIVTNYVQMPWTTLTLTGTNVSALNLAAGSMFKITATNNLYFGVPSGLPGTNLAQTIQIHILQDGTGGRTVTMTNSAWLLSGSGASTNAVPTVNTNANGVTILTFVTSPFSSTLLYGVPTAFAP